MNAPDFLTVGFGLLTVRLVFGLTMAAHGAQKLFGWFGGYGLRATSAGFETIGFRPGRFFASAAGVVEFTGGLLTALGLFGPFGPSLMVSVMIVAAAIVHWKNGFFAPMGVELNLLFGAAALSVALSGAGTFSLDAWLGLEGLRNASLTWVSLAAAVIGAVVVISARRPVQQSPAASQG